MLNDNVGGIAKYIKRENGIKVRIHTMVPESLAYHSSILFGQEGTMTHRRVAPPSRAERSAVSQDKYIDILYYAWQEAARSVSSPSQAPDPDCLKFTCYLSGLSATLKETITCD